MRVRMPERRGEGGHFRVSHHQPGPGGEGVQHEAYLCRAEEMEIEMVRGSSFLVRRLPSWLCCFPVFRGCVGVCACVRECVYKGWWKEARQARQRPVCDSCCLLPCPLTLAATPSHSYCNALCDSCYQTLSLSLPCPPTLTAMPSHMPSHSCFYAL